MDLEYLTLKFMDMIERGDKNRILEVLRFYLCSFYTKVIGKWLNTYKEPLFGEEKTQSELTSTLTTVINLFSKFFD